MTKPLERAEARRLRAEGMSVREIAQQLGVAKASVSVWVRDIALTDAQQSALRDNDRHYDARQRGSRANMQKGLAQRLAYQQEGRAKAREGDPLHLAGCMLYWAEGAKTRNQLKLVNSDAEMMRFFIRFLRQSLNVPNETFRVHINCYLNNGVALDVIENYWLNLLELTHDNLRKSLVHQQPITSKQRGRKLLYGVCALSVYQTQLVQHVLGAIQEYIGIDKAEWLL